MVEQTSHLNSAPPGNTPPNCHDALPASVSNEPNALIRGDVSPGFLPAEQDTPLTDELREFEIARAGRLVDRFMARYAVSGCFADRGDADRARLLMEQLIAGRSAAQIGRMLEAQAERMAQEPGAEKGAA